MLEIEYDPLLVVISIAVAVLGSWTALALARSISQQRTTAIQTVVTYVNSAVIMGGSVWAMHFIAMLSLSFPVAVTYTFTETVASLVLAIAVGGTGIFIASRKAMGASSAIVGGALFGLGAVGMHYIGVLAIRGCGVSFDPYSVGLSAMIAIVGAAAALWTAFRGDGIARTAAGGLVLGATVAWVHYTGMYATTFLSNPSMVAVSRPHLPQSVLAYAIAMTAIAVCSAQLLMVSGAAAKLGRSHGVS